MGGKKSRKKKNQNRTRTRDFDATEHVHTTTYITGEICSVLQSYSGDLIEHSHLTDRIFYFIPLVKI